MLKLGRERPLPCKSATLSPPLSVHSGINGRDARPLITLATEFLCVQGVVVVFVYQTSSTSDRAEPVTSVPSLPCQRGALMPQEP